MGSIKNRLRHRQNKNVQKVDLIDITEDTEKMSPKFIEIIDLTDSHSSVAANVDPERLVDFRHRVLCAFRKGKKQSMFVWNLARRVNYENKERFSKKELDSALLLMANANEIWMSNGLSSRVE